MRRLTPQLRSHAAVAVIGIFATRLAADILGVLTGGARPMYIEPWLFLVLLFGTALSISGLLIGAVALVMLLLRRRPRRVVVKKQPAIRIVGSDGRPL